MRDTAQFDGDEKGRLPLGPVTAWAIARVALVLHLKQRTTPITPPEVREFLRKELGWANPSNHSLYRGILAKLREKAALEADAITKPVEGDSRFDAATEFHPVTVYSLGEWADEFLRTELFRIEDDLTTSRRLLRALADISGGCSSQAEPKVIVNTATMLRWLVLWACSDGPATLPDVMAKLRKLSGGNWPSISMMHRAVRELESEYYGAVRLLGKHPTVVEITPAGRQVMENLRPHIARECGNALAFIEAGVNLIQRLRPEGEN